MKEEYTAEQAIKECYLIWVPLTREETYKDIDWGLGIDVEELECLKHDIAKKINKTLKLHCGCPCCKFDDLNDFNFCRENCLIEWSGGYCNRDPIGEYHEWTMSKDTKEACKNAKAIVKLIKLAAKEREIKLTQGGK